MDPEALLAELARYEAEIANIESRFIRITESLFYIKTDDDALIRQRVEQLIEILNDAFGVNNYSRQISADFNRAFRNYPPDSSSRPQYFVDDTSSTTAHPAKLVISK